MHTVNTPPLACCLLHPGYADVLQFLIDHNASTCMPGSDGGLLSCRNYDGVQHLLEKNRKSHLNK